MACDFAKPHVRQRYVALKLDGLYMYTGEFHLVSWTRNNRARHLRHFSAIDAKQKKTQKGYVAGFSGGRRFHSRYFSDEKAGKGNLTLRVSLFGGYSQGET